MLASGEGLMLHPNMAASVKTSGPRQAGLGQGPSPNPSHAASEPPLTLRTATKFKAKTRLGNWPAPVKGGPLHHVFS